MSHLRTTSAIWLLLVTLCSQSLAALELAPLFKDHAVFQRNQDIPIYGWSKPAQTITVELNSKQYKTQSDSAGKWQVTLDKQPASGPFILQVNSAKTTITLKDIYFGDVWLASGQSNMEWKFKWHVNGGKEEVANSDLPLIRYFDVSNRYSNKKQEKLGDDKWLVAHPSVANNFSAVAWLFGKQVHLAQGVAIGIIDASWGGTPAEAWTPAKTLENLPSYRQAAISIQDDSKDWPTLFEQEEINSKLKKQLITSKDGFNKKQLASTNFDDSAWPRMQLPNPDLIEGITWFRHKLTIDQQPDSNGRASIELGNYPQALQVYVNNTLVGEKTPEHKAKSFDFDASLLVQGPNTISLRAANAWNNQFRIGKPAKMFIQTADMRYSIEGEWTYSNDVAVQFPTVYRYWQYASVLYNAMIHPLRKFPLKGVIWYQGESNIHQADAYHDLFSAMINQWRHIWQQPKLPFLFVQLASMHPQRTAPYDSEWALLREAQTQTLALPHTGMAVIIDAGDPWDIHPRNKHIVAERLWQAAKVIAYKEKGLASGPMAKKIKRKHDSIIVSFEYVANELIANGKLLGFEIAASDGKYRVADAVIKGKKVIVSHPDISNPQSVRYGWADNSPANLYNSVNLPAIPFRLGE